MVASSALPLPPRAGGSRWFTDGRGGLARRALPRSGDDEGVTSDASCSASPSTLDSAATR